jgi:hypothetical protein
MGGGGASGGGGERGGGGAILSCWPRRGPIQHSHFYRGGRGVALLSWWPRSGPIQHSHFHRVGRGVARATILTSTVVAAEWPDSAFSFPSWCPRNGRSPHSHFYRSGCGVPDPLIVTSHFYHVSLCFSLFFSRPRRGRVCCPPCLVKCVSRRISSAELTIGGLRLIPVPGAAAVMVVDRPLQRDKPGMMWRPSSASSPP